MEILRFANYFAKSCHCSTSFGIVAIMNINDKCSKYFRYIDFIECSDTQKKVKVDNSPKELATYEAISYLAKTIMDPIVKQFGQPQITYGLCSHNLQKHIKKSVAPSLDQHSGSERNSKGNLICPRGGIAVDFKIENIKTEHVAQYIVEHLKFDRLYFYGSDRPLHVSANAETAKQAIVVFNTSNRGRTPKTLTYQQFLDFIDALMNLPSGE